jgi:dCMP deaminase
MDTWDKRWMDMAALVATWSKENSRKIAAVVVDSRNVLVSIGWNGFPRGIDDDVLARSDRPAKYLWTEHAERNAIYNAAANGIKLGGCRMYIPWYPCSDCARAIIQSGITQLLCAEPDWEDEIWKDKFAVSKDMLGESGVNVTFLVGIEPPVSK